MSDKGKELGWLNELIKAMKESLKDGLRFYPRDDDIDKLKQLYQQLIQQKPEVDEKYVKGKIKEILEHDKKDDTPLDVAMGIVTQIISDVRGGGK